MHPIEIKKMIDCILRDYAGPNTHGFYRCTYSYVEIIKVVKPPCASQLCTYLMECLPSKRYSVSGCVLLPLAEITENAHHAAPIMYLTAYGLTQIASNSYGDAICVSNSSGSVLFADHELVDEEGVYYRRSGEEEFHYVKFSDGADEALSHLPLLSTDFGGFMLDLLEDKLEEKLHSVRQ